jgi:RNA polymerase sigma-70 factor (ECF subfamily)
VHPTTHQSPPARLAATAPRRLLSGDAVVLLRRAQAGDRDAFGQLYTRYTPPVRRYIAARTRDRDVVADLVQDTFVAALQNLHRAHYDVHGWFLRLAATMCDRHAGAQRRYLRAARSTGEHQRCLAATTPTDGEATRRLIAGALAALHPRQRLAVQLRYLDGHPQVTTARIMGCSRDTVRRVEHRALRQLTAHLTDPAGRAPSDR